METQNEIIEWHESQKYETKIWKDGLYPAQLKEVQNATGQYGLMKRFLFTVINNEQQYETAEFPITAYPRLNDKTKFGTIVTALGHQQGKDLKLTDLYQKPCQVLLETKTYETTDKKGVVRKVTASVITKVLPPPKLSFAGVNTNGGAV